MRPALLGVPRVSQTCKDVHPEQQFQKVTLSRTVELQTKGILFEMSHYLLS